MHSRHRVVFTSSAVVFTSPAVVSTSSVSCWENGRIRSSFIVRQCLDLQVTCLVPVRLFDTRFCIYQMHKTPRLDRNCISMVWYGMVYLFCHRQYKVISKQIASEMLPYTVNERRPPYNPMVVLPQLLYR